MRVADDYVNNLSSVSPEELKAQARMKEFQIKKLVEFVRLVPNANSEMFATAMELSKELVEAEQALQQARFRVTDIKSNLARLIR